MHGKKCDLGKKGLIMDSKEFSEKVRKILLDLWEETLSEASKQLQLTKEQGLFDLIGASGDEVDISSIDVDREIDYTVVNIYNRRLLDIRKALDRIEREEYGYCEECGGKISAKRLEVIPFARYCLNCQSEIEALNKAKESRK
jgi:DnaK suppressor protein